MSLLPCVELIAPADIFSPCDEFEVGVANARRVGAEVIPLQPPRWSADEEVVRPDEATPRQESRSAASVVVREPEPARPEIGTMCGSRAVLVDLCPEALSSLGTSMEWIAVLQYPVVVKTAVALRGTLVDDLFAAVMLADSARKILAKAGGDPCVARPRQSEPMHVAEAASTSRLVAAGYDAGVEVRIRAHRKASLSGVAGQAVGAALPSNFTLFSTLVRGAA